MKRVLVLLFSLIVMVSFSACGSDYTDEQQALIDKYGVNEASTVINDNTGNFRKNIIANSTPTSEYAMDYYRAFFESDEEIHYVVNLTLKTTTKIAVVGDQLNVTTYEYVDGEEHDAATIGSGMVLADDFIDI